MITVIGNLKGGTGKSTVTFNLAVWLRLAGVQLAVFDLDPQNTLMDVDALRREQGIEPALRVQPGPFSRENLPGDADEILIDVGAADLESFKQALMVADRVLIPVGPSQADIWSTQRFIRLLDAITHGRPPEAFTFINRADTNRAIPASDEATAALVALPGARLLPQRLSNRTVFRDSFSEGLAVFELEPRGRGSREFKALAAALYGQKRGAAKGAQRKASPAGESHVGQQPGPETPPPDRDSAVGVRVEKEKRRKKPKKSKKDKPGRKNKAGKKQKKKNKAGKTKKANKARKGKAR